MYTLPRNLRFTIRRLEKPLRALVQVCVPQWSGDKVSIFITDRVEKRSNYEEPEFTRIDLVSGEREVVPRFNASRHYIAVAAGEAIVRADRADLVRGEVVIYILAFSDRLDLQDELDVARDAVLEGDLRAAHRIAKSVLPHSHGLFEALVGHEHKRLRAGSVADRDALGSSA